jgi:LacI family transcriptional regulator
MSVRLIDIANATGFSLMTVSLVLNPRKGECRISKKTQEKIKKVAKEMNYTPNMPARILSGASSNVVGVMFNSVKNCFYSELQRRIDIALRKHGLVGFYTFWGNQNEFEKSLEAMKQFNVCGILTGHDLQANYPEVPIICYGTLNKELDSIYPNEEDMMSTAVNYALKQGYSKIGFAGLIELSHRAKAFEEVLHKAKLSPSCKIIIPKDSLVKENVDQFLAKYSDTEVLIFGSDQTAIEWMAELQSRGIKLPQDLKIISVNNTEDCENIYPRLTSVDFQLSSLGDILVEKLLNKLNTPSNTREDFSLPTRIVERASCPAKKEKLQ